MTGKDEFYALMAKRLRELRLFLGYKTAASFARALGYPPNKYNRYERRGISNSDVLKRLVDTIEATGHGKVRWDWLLNCRTQLMFGPPANWPVSLLRTEGNVVRVNFAR